ncbi:MAG: CDP-alcohol phosphatidyltransferase family protein [Candidatus Methylomirabilia bacterium]
MLSRKYKSTFGEYIRPVNLILHRLRVRADRLTFAGMIFGGLAGLAFAQARLVLGGIFLILAGLSDMLDGSLARSNGEASRFGSYIDSVADRFTEALVFTGVAWHLREKPELLVVLAALAGSYLVSYAKARAEALGVSCEVGLMERPERIILLVAGALLNQLVPALWVLATLTLFTAGQRVLHVRQAMRSRT